MTLKNIIGTPPPNPWAKPLGMEEFLSKLEPSDRDYLTDVLMDPEWPAETLSKRLRAAYPNERGLSAPSIRAWREKHVAQ